MTAGRVTQLIEISVDDKLAKNEILRLMGLLEPPAIAGFLGTRVDPWLRSRARDRFHDEGDDVVGKWVPLAAATRKIRASQGYGPDHPINRRTGELEEYIAGSVNRISVTAVGATMYFPGSPPSGRLRSKVQTAQAGSDKPRTPARPVLGVNERDLGYVMTSLELYIRGVAF